MDQKHENVVLSGGETLKSLEAATGASDHRSGGRTEQMTLIELDDSYLPQMAELCKAAFSGEPWNDDWSDTAQLTAYMKDLSQAHNALSYGLLVDGKLVGMSVGRVNHWWEGTSYNIDEFCISPVFQGQGLGSRFLGMIEKCVREKGLAGIFLQTENNKPSYRFYQKNGFKDLDTYVCLYKSVEPGKESQDKAADGGI